MESKKLRIALLLGGTSSEREISKSSSASIYTALISLGYEVILIDPAYGLNQPKEVKQFFEPKDYSEISNANYVKALNSDLLNDVDLVFIGLHGLWGEDGTVQSLLELRGLKYTGSKVLSSAISMDKIMSKILFGHYGISTPKWLSYSKTTANIESIKSNIKEEIGFPCVIKPNDQGSTVGLSIVKSEEEIETAVNLGFQYSSKILIEEYIDGYEMTVGIIENKALPVLEIKPKHGIYDFECKYTSGMSEYIVPADIPKETELLLQSQALLAFTSLECEIYGRIDFRVSKDYKIYCLEVNTLPGMTATSLVPKMAKASGIMFEDLIDRIIKLSL